MPRPAFTPDPEQQRLLNEAIAHARRADQEEDETWAAIKRGRDAGIPDTLLCEATNRSRATLNRRYGPRTEAPPDPAPN